MVFDFKRFDIYRKVPKDLTQPTKTGALISLCSISFILFLFVSELYHFMNGDIVTDLYVDDPDKSSKQIKVQINITLPYLPCKYIGLDIQDEQGRHEVGYLDSMVKIPTDNKKGCWFQGKFFINKVPGNFHISTHSANEQPKEPDMRHIIHGIQMGDKMALCQWVKERTRSASFNPLHDHAELEGEKLHSHDYVLKVVPSMYEHLSGQTTYSYQYTYAHKQYLAFSHHGAAMPAIWFRYELTPMTVRYREHRAPLYTFLTTVCAIVGGTFTVAGIIDSLVFSTAELFKKFEMGKLS